jgi:hypothetical protein
MDWSKPWKHSLIVKVLGRNINFKVLENKLQKTWARSGTIQVSDMAENYYLVKFVSEDDYNHALFEGPWKVADHYIMVQRWRKFFSLTAEISKKVAVWIRIPKLPIELCNHRFLWRIGSTLGTMLKVDRLTSIHSRGKFARICVELDLEKQLASHIMLRGTRVNLEYEGLHAICFSCGRYGHKIDNGCERMEKENNEKTNMDTESADLIVEKTPDIEGSPKGVEKGVLEVKKTLMEQNYGNWMVVKKPPKKGPSKPKGNHLTSPTYITQVKNVKPKQPLTSGSRFDLLKEIVQPEAIKDMTNSNGSISLKGSQIFYYTKGWV